MRIGQIPESGTLVDLSSDCATVLVWAGGPQDVAIEYRSQSGERIQVEFKRNPGSIDLMPPDVLLHRVVWEGKACVCTAVNFPQASLLALCPTGSLDLDRTAGPSFGLTDAHVFDLVKRLQAQAQGPDFFGALYVQSLSLALVSYLAARYGSAAQTPQLQSQAGLTLAQRRSIEDFVETELASNFGLIDLAALLGYGPDHFSRLFKITFEDSPHQYVLARRIERAKSLLRDDQLKITEIALNCGFSSQAHMTTAFKRHTGTTPANYRKA